jgi:SAM-dependent methyltransferase
MTVETLAYRLGCFIHWTPRERAIRKGLEALPASVIEGARLLDVGSGLGQLSRLARELGLEYVGLEPADALRQEAARDFPGTVFLARGAENLQEETRPGDVVVLNGVAHHLSGDLFEETLEAARGARALVLCDHLRLDGKTHALARFLQDRDQGKFVRPYSALLSPPGFVLRSSEFFPIGPLGMPFWTYFCNVYTVS